MAQTVFSNPYVSQQPALSGQSVGNGTLTIDRLTHFTITQTYTVVCTAIAPFTVFKVIGSLDGAVGVAVVGQQFYDEDLKVFFTVNQGPTLFEIGDTFTFEVTQGTDLNRENIDLYDELPQKNFGQGIAGELSGDNNLRFTLNAVDASLSLQDLSFLSKIAGKDGNNISLEYLAGSVISNAQKTIQDIVYTAQTGGIGGNDISIEYIDWSPAVEASKTIQGIYYTALATGPSGNSISINYLGGGTAGAEVASILGSAITVQIEAGVSTVNQIRTALLGNPTIAALIYASIAVGSTGLDPQGLQAPTFLEGGADAIGQAGFEVVSVIGTDIQVILQSGVSTAQQVADAINGFPAAFALVSASPIVGNEAIGQLAPVAQTFLEGGTDNIGIPGQEIVEVDGRNVKITFVSGLSTAQNIKDALEADVDANALFYISLLGDGSEPQLSPVSRRYLRGGRPVETYSFNAKEITDADAFFEGNASILIKDLIVQGQLMVEDEIWARGVLKLDDDDSTNLSGPTIPNAQKAINSITQNDKILVQTVDNSPVLWTGTEIQFSSDLSIIMPDTGIVNTIETAESPIALADGESLYVVLDRYNNAIVSPLVGIPAQNGENFVLAYRNGTDIIWRGNNLQRANQQMSIGSSPSPQEYEKVLDNTDITNQYIDLPHYAEPASLLVRPNGGPLQVKDDDYAVSIVSGVTRLTFNGDLASRLELNDKLIVKYVIS